MVLDFMKVPQQYCLFHVKQKINRDIKTYINQNNIFEEKIDVILNYKYMIFNLLDADDIDDAKQIRFDLISKHTNMPKVIKKIMDDLIIPDFKKLTYHLQDKNIESRSNKLENCFKYVFGTAIK